ncbi:hypothetical protein BOW50_12480 [Solemya velum gill symbiont]|uniref:class-II fumarase/aspartase family protein n=1 Tax=Solemya velum gill symbiont TaxID=2340 RepID=UPI00099809DA|nr:adenylosuccinate lyase family protein [Solemya velum gill symbiont]OOZ74457.1 hypothetical protein BOW50_12480 [Solemya velum gill symbiont]
MEQIRDSQFFGDSFGTNESRAIFSDLARFQRWLDVEVALANSQAVLNIIPKSAATEIEQSARLENFDLEYLKRELALSGHSLIPLLKAFQAVCEPEASKYIHYGATTQDIQDTAQSIEILSASNLIERELTEICLILQQLAENNKSIVMVGRTHAQAALPTTLGLKFATWLDETARNLVRLQTNRDTVCVAQLFGGVGTMSAFEGKGMQLLEVFSDQLELQAPSTAWHTSRDRVVEFISTMCLISGGLAHIANEILQLAKTEIGELQEPYKETAIGSSTMPHKVNPEASEQVITLAHLVKSNASLAFDSLVNEHERDYRTLRLEWVTLPDSVIYTTAALKLMKSILSGLRIKYERIAENVSREAQSICSEALMFALSDELGKSVAFDVVREAYAQEKMSNEELVDHIMASPHARDKALDKGALLASLNPDNYIGEAEKIVDSVLENTASINNR